MSSFDAYVVLDDLSTGHKEAVINGTFIRGNFGNNALLDQIFKEHHIDAVMHFAACIDVGESVRDPGKYYQNNLAHTITLINTMVENNISILIFSSSAAVYGKPEYIPVDEKHPCKPANPYGTSKLLVEQILQDFPLKYCILRYFNAVGGDPMGQLKNWNTKQHHLIAAILRDRAVTIFGSDYSTPDGTGIRDYVHIDDIARAHKIVLEKLLEGGPSTAYNLGSEKGHSVREVIATVEKVTKLTIKVTEGSRREGDVPIIISDASKARAELGWEPVYTLADMIEHAWKASQQ